MQQSYHVIPEHIRKNISKFKHHRTNVMCKECGYTGTMGISSAKKHFRASLFLLCLAILCALFMFFVRFSAIPFFILGMFYIVFIITVFSKVELECPNCEAILLIKNK